MPMIASSSTDWNTLNAAVIPMFPPSQKSSSSTDMMIESLVYRNNEEPSSRIDSTNSSTMPESTPGHVSGSTIRRIVDMSPRPQITEASSSSGWTCMRDDESA